MQREQNHLYKIISTQLGLVVFCTILLLFASWHAAYSFLIGALCCLIPNFIFGRQLFNYPHARQAQQAMKVFYRGEAFKLVLIGVLSVLVFIYIPILPFLFFAGFLAGQVSFWISNVYWLRKLARPETAEVQA